MGNVHFVQDHFEVPAYMALFVTMYISCVLTLAAAYLMWQTMRHFAMARTVAEAAAAATAGASLQQPLNPKLGVVQIDACCTRTDSKTLKIVVYACSSLSLAISLSVIIAAAAVDFGHIFIVYHGVICILNILTLIAVSVRWDKVEQQWISGKDEEESSKG